PIERMRSDRARRSVHLQHGPMERTARRAPCRQQSAVDVEEDQSPHRVSMTWRVLLAAPLAFAGAVWFYLIVLPWPVTLRWRDPESTAFMRARVAQAESRGDSLALRYDFVPLDNISRHLRRA